MAVETRTLTSIYCNECTRTYPFEAESVRELRSRARADGWGCSAIGPNGQADAHDLCPDCLG